MLVLIARQGFARFLPALGLLGLLAGCAHSTSAAEGAAPPRGKVRVTLLLFSGRPNPSFEIDPKAVAERLAPDLRATRAIESAADETVVPGTLGYNGIVVENEAGLPDLPRTLIVYRDRVETRDGKRSLRADPGRHLEEALLRLALEQKVIDEKTLEWTRAESPPR